MTDKEINETIAKACGWEQHKSTWAHVCLGLSTNICYWVHPRFPHKQFLNPPDYVNDLNAMHEAEKVLRTNLDCIQAHAWNNYCYQLKFYLEDVGVFDNNCVHATARQRAEGFLYVMALIKKEMSDSEINIAIAKVCGWRQLTSHFGGYEGIWADKNGYEHTCIPNYVGSLDAMHEAEKVLTLEQHNEYVTWLIVIVVATGNPLAHEWNATARQRAEAFLRVFDLWNEQKA